MKLLTKRLVLRELSMKDAKDIAKVANDPTIWYFTEVIPYPYTLKDAKNFVRCCQKERKKRPRDKYDLGIELKSKRKIIGAIGLYSKRLHKRVTIGYWVGKAYRKQGIASEAEKVLLDFAFNKLKLNKVSGDAAIENKASNALFKKFGFRKIGIKKEELIKNNPKLRIRKKLDTYSWELLRKDYMKKRKMMKI